MSKTKHVYLVDGSGYIFRAFHALPPLTRSDGTHVNAVLGFTNMLLKLLDETDADHIGVIFDAGRSSFRNEIYANYKANRPEAPPELIPQFGMVREATRACNVACIEMEGYEADDIIATYACRAKEAGADVTIVSSDKDLMQLVNDKVRMWDPIKNKPISYPEVQEKFGVTPDKVIDIQALAGDSTDNVPGVPGIGVKTAAELINAYGSLEALLERANEIKQPKRRENLIANAELARISKQLVTLSCDVKLDTPLEGLERRKLEVPRLLEFVKVNEFRALATRIMARHGGEGNGTGPKVDTAPPAAPAIAGTSLAAAPVPALPAPSAAAPISFDKYELVQDKATLERWVREAREQGYVAFDVETTSLHVVAGELCGFSLALAPGKACYAPVGHGGASGDLLGGATERPKQISLTEALAILGPLLEDPSVMKIGHNIKFDLCVMSKYGIEVAPIDDTMLVSYALEGGAHGHGMDELSEMHLSHKPIAYGDVCGTGKSAVTFDKVTLDKALNYAAEDADVTLRLHQMLKPRLVPEHVLTVYEAIDRPLIPVVAAMECAGIKVDTKALQALSKDFAGRIVEIEREIQDIAGFDFNPGSPKQLGEVLFDKLKLPGGKKGKTGAYATGADVLEELTVVSGHPLPQKILDWRQLTKLKSTYTDTLQNEIDPTTGRVHTSYALALTPTGRLSSSDPNLQNIPVRTEEGRKIRHAFVAEKGHKLLSVDYSQIEMRLAADMADIPALRDAFRDGKDIHAITASQVFGVPIEGMDPMVRRRAKAINFGIIYGISAFGLAQQLGIPQAEARDYIGAYFARYPGIREYMERCKKFARDHGYVETLFGRRCHVPGINDKNPARRSYMERAAINAPLQGTAADIIKRAMIRIPPALKERGLNARMLLQVHDELVFEVPEAEVEETSAIARAIMEKAHEPARKLAVPLTCDAGAGQNWAEAH
ncbi:DNA polymerase I [Dongia deserti]|uniref:DNA polymerase I n=1 Tax=Dongia deserti TaxID=2268030 RepID=UPI000E65B733|nr:DNA polymerase I [Dongia deserti]